MKVFSAFWQSSITFNLILRSWNQLKLILLFRHKRFPSRILWRSPQQKRSFYTLWCLSHKCSRKSKTKKTETKNDFRFVGFRIIESPRTIFNDDFPVFAIREWSKLFGELINFVKMTAEILSDLVEKFRLETPNLNFYIIILNQYTSQPKKWCHA